ARSGAHTPGARDRCGGLRRRDPGADRGRRARLARLARAAGPAGGLRRPAPGPPPAPAGAHRATDRRRLEGVRERMGPLIRFAALVGAGAVLGTLARASVGRAFPVDDAAWP